jgi:uncharacterized protein (TIGR02996 family)
MTAADRDLAAITRAACEAPHDDLPRLALADWCDDNGRPERAEFVRLQIELHHLVDGPGMCPKDEGRLCRSMRCQSCLLRRRVGQVLLAENRHWDPLPFPSHAEADYAPFRGRGHARLFARGMVEQVRCELSEWRRCGREAAERHPLRRAELSDRRPDVWGRGLPGTSYCWYGTTGSFQHAPQPGFAHHLPRPLFALLSGGEVREEWYRHYAGEREAEDDLSGALLALARGDAPSQPDLKLA